MNRKIRTSVAAAGLAGSLLFGGAGIALAQSSSTTATTATATTATTGTNVRPDRSTQLASTLAPLVSAGTITQAQADAVVKALVAAQPAGGGGMGGGPGRGGGGGGGGGKNTAAAATALGMTEADLRTALQSGQSIAQVATSKGVSLQTVINALVAAEKLQHPDQTEASIVARVTNQVNGVRTARPATAATTVAA